VEKIARRILCVGTYAELVHTRSLIFAQAGYSVKQAHTKEEAKRVLARESFDVVILEHCIHMKERHALAAFVKQTSPQTRILVLHASGSGSGSHADAALDSRGGPAAILQAMQSLFVAKKGPQAISKTRASAGSSA